MMTKGHRLYILIMCLVFFIHPLCIKAQTDSTEYWKNKYLTSMCCGTETFTNPIIVTTARMVGAGVTNILDTYLSPQKYSGMGFSYISHTTRKRACNHWSRQIIYQGNIAYTHNNAENCNEMYGLFYFSYGIHRNLKLLNNKLILKVGALFDVNLGFLYNTRNGNNPAQAKVYVNITPSVQVEYHINKYTIRYEADVPLAGLMFSPNYEQSYYDIFSNGNYDRNIVPTTFISTPSLRQTLTLDIPMRRATLRLGYMGDYQQAHVNNLKSHTYTHSFIIGVVKTFSINNIL